MSITNYTELIKAEAMTLGFSDCGITQPSPLAEDKPHLLNWLHNNMYGEMGYMNNNIDIRLNPELIYTEAKSVISVILNYKIAHKQIDSTAPKVSRHVIVEDYHKIIKSKLKKLLKFIKEIIPDADGRFFVDSAPILERSLAKSSGIGWIGKNACLISKQHGSFVFIGELLLNKELIYDKPAKDYCGNCNKCIDACPTKAIINAHVIDATKCISYLTQKTDMPEVLKGKINNYVYGCDICQDACPWNDNANYNDTIKINHYLLNLTKKEWDNLTPEMYDKLSAESPIKHITYEKLKKNIEFVR